MVFVLVYMAASGVVSVEVFRWCLFWMLAFWVKVWVRVSLVCVWGFWGVCEVLLCVHVSVCCGVTLL